MNYLVHTSVRIVRVALMSATALSGIAIATPALAQEAEAEEDDSNTIVVIGRISEESLQEVPVAITAISGDTLDNFRIDEAVDVASRIPALNVQVGGSGAGAQISLRGVGSSNISNSFDSAVALNVDGVSVSTQRLLQSAFFDLAQIEVLKGPQSLFFGKAASAGVLSLRSADPTADWEIGGKASYEFEEKGYTVGGYISGPVTDTLGIRVAAEYQDISNFVELQDGVPALDPDKNLTNFIGRVTLAWEPTDNFKANLKLNYNEQRSETLNGRTDVFCGGDGIADPSFLAVFGLAFAPTHDCNIDDNRFPTPDGIAAIDTVPTGSPGEGRDISQAFNDTNLFFGRLSFDVGLTDTFTLSSISGYVSMQNEYNDSFNSTGQTAGGLAAGLTAPFRNTLEQFTQELRLASDFSGPFNFTVGAFWENRESGLVTAQNAFNPSIVLGPDALTGFTFDWLADRPLSAEAVSFFGSASFDVSDKLNLSGGVRWTDEQKSTTIAFPFVNSFVTGALGAVPSGFFTGPIRFSDSNVSPEAVITYKATEDINVYAAFKTGFKSGGVDNNTLPTGAVVLLNDPDPAVAEAAADALRFDSETSIGGELGLRSQFADQSLTFNLTGFYYVFDDLQVQVFDPGIFNFETFNAGELTTFGVDLDWAWITPLEGLSFNGSVGWLSSEFTDDFITAPGENLDGRDAARAPSFSGNVAANWDIPVGESLEFGLNGNIRYSGSYFTSNSTLQSFDDSPTNTNGANGGLNNLVQDDFFTFDARISIGDPDGKWSLSLIGVNLSDEIFINTSAVAPFIGPGGDDQLVTLSRGRQIFIETSFKF